MLKKLIAIFLASGMIICITSTNVSAAHDFYSEEETEEIEEAEEKTIWEVYDSQGNLVGETTDPDNFQVDKDNQLLRKDFFKKLVQTITASVAYQAIAFISTIHYAIDSSISTINWINSHLDFSGLSDGKYKIKIYSMDGNITNPYPPHSQQGAMWNRNNFYYSIEK